MRSRERFNWSYRVLTDIPDAMIGVYLFWYRPTGKCIYIGMAADQPIRNRLRQHWLGSHNEALRLWMKAFGDELDLCYVQAEPNRVRTLERRLIRALSPEANKQHKE